MVPHISPKNINDYVIALPSITEQEKIVNYLDEELNKIDELQNKIEKAISMHREYRTALISATVTGKIKVPQEQNIHHEHANQ